MPEMKEVASYGAIILLRSWWNEKNELCVDFSPDIKPNLKLQHHYKYQGNYYCVPNKNSGYFGAVATQADTIEEAIEQANEIASQVICLGLEYDEISLERAKKKIDAGRQFGIEF